MKKIICVLIFSITSWSAFSQNFKDDINLMNEAYKKPGFLSILVTVNMYENQTSPVLLQKATIKKKDKKYFYDVGNTKMIMTEEAILMVHEKEKTIVFRQVNSQEYERLFKRTIGFSVDSIISKYDSVQYKGSSTETKHYCIFTSKGLIKKTDLFLNAVTNQITKIVYQYNELANKNAYKIEILFTNSATSFSEDIFSLNKYLKKSEAGYELQPQYNSYSLINTSHEK